MSAASIFGARWAAHADALPVGIALLAIPVLVMVARARQWFPPDGPAWGERAFHLALLYLTLNLLALVVGTHTMRIGEPDAHVARLFSAGWITCYTYALPWFWPRDRRGKPSAERTPGPTGTR